MSETLEFLKTECKRICSKLNITKYDVFGVISEENSASSKENKPFALTASSKTSVKIRVWTSPIHVGLANTSNLTTEGLENAIEIAKNSSQFSDSSIVYDFSPLCLNELNCKIEDDKFNFVSIQSLAQASIECESKILNSHSSFKSVPYNKIAQSFFEHFYFNSLNSFRHQRASSSFCYFYPLAQVENKLPRQMGHLTIAKNFENLDYSECAQIAIEKTKSHLNYEKVETGNYTVVLSPYAFLDLIQAFGNFFNAQNVLDKKSLSTKDTLNTKLASELLNIVDSPFHEKNIGKSYFDEEGTPTNEFVIIENGVLKNFIHTSYSAKMFNTSPSGHTYLGSKLTASPHYLRIFANKLSHINVAPKNENTIYVENVKALHAGINALQGSFSLPFDGFLVNAEKKVSIESATIAGDFFSLLKNIIYVSPAEIMTPSGICPEIWVKDISVTGC